MKPTLPNFLAALVSKMSSFKNLSALLVMLLFSGGVWGQSIANYSFSSGTASLDPMVGASSVGGAIVNGYNDDYASAVNNIGFNFVFMGVSYSQFSVNSNGQLRLGATVVQGTNYAAAAATTAIICPMSGDNSAGLSSPSTTNPVTFKVSGSAGSRILIVQWINFNISFSSTSTNGGTMQLWLYEATGKIEFHYGSNYGCASNSTRSIFISSSNTTTTSGYVTVGASPVFTATATAVTNSIVAGTTIANLSGVKYTFTPPQQALAAPTSLTFTSITSSGMTLNWAAASPTTGVEGYAVYYSSDSGVTYNFANTTPLGTNTLAVTGLTSGTNYLWKVYSFSEAVYSTDLPGSQSTAFGSSTAGNGTYTVPEGVCSIIVETWGAGGGGGGVATTSSCTGGGGGGGAYSKATFTVVPNTTYNFTVGAGGTAGAGSATVAGTGGSTYFGNSSAGNITGASVLAVGGSGGTGTTTSTGGAGGAGGLSSSGTGSTKFSGGYGGSGNGITGPGAGGGSGGSGVDGNFTTATTGSAGTVAPVSVTGGVAGMTGPTSRNSPGITGNAGGGGGSGAWAKSSSAVTKAGGVGGVGKIVISINTVVSGTSATPIVSPICNGATSISGTSTDADGTTIEIFSGVTSLGTTTVTSNAWTKSGLTALVTGASITAKAYTCGKLNSTASTAIIVKALTTSPTLTSPICNAATSISGTSTEADGTTITVFKGGVSQGTATVATGTWTLSGLSSIATNDIITGTATASGKCESVASTSVTVNACTDPLLTASSITSFGNQCASTTSSPNSFTISAINLTTADITIASLSGYSFSLTSGGSYTSTLTIPQPGGSLASTTIYVKFSPTLVQSYNGDIVISGGGLASNVTVAATGAGINSLDGLSHTSQSVSYCTGSAITTNTATLTTTGGTVTYSVSPTLPTGLSLNTSNGNITGTPTLATVATDYVVTASNGCSTTTSTVNITVLTAMSGLNYTLTSATYCAGSAITANAATVSGSGNITYTVNPSLPSGLALNTSTGEITGTPTTATASATYTVTASNGVCSTTKALTIVVGATLNGTYTVGSGGNYATLTAAVTAYNSDCLSGPIVFSLTDTTYSTSEVFPIIINANSGANATNTLTIKPASGVTATISGSSAVAIFKLNGADYVIIDGSNSGGTDKSLTISNANTGTSSAVIWLGSASVSNGATNNTIKNCIITGNAPTTTFGGIISSSGTTIGNIAEVANANNTYNNNTVNTVKWGITVVGPTVNESGTVISGNLIGSATAGNKIGLKGIAIYQQTGVSVTGNTVFGVTTATSSTASGIYVSGTQSGGTISGNKISDIKNTSTSGFGSNGIGLYSSSTTGNVTLQNNMIYDVAAYGYTTVTEEDNGYGIMINSGGGYNVYFNTVSLSVNQTTAGISAAINIASAVTALNIRNNIFRNSQTTGTRYAIYTAGTAAGFTTINFNDYSTSGSVGFLTSARATLGNWQTASTQDANSIGVAPTFTSATDLHLTAAGNCSINNAGTPISGITTDYDGATRSTTTPDIGADEFTGDINTAGAASSTPTLCNNTILTNITHATTVATGIGTATGLPTGVTAAWASNTITISGTPTASGTFNYTIPLSGGTCSVNATGTITVNPLPTALVLTGSSACAGATGTITSSTSVSGVDYQLYDSANAAVGSVQAGTGSGLTWSSVAIATGYYAKATNATTSCVSSNSNNVAVATITDKTWLGTTSTSWNTASNWSCNAVPVASDVIVISSGSPVLDTNFTVGAGGSLTLSDTGTLTISPTSTLTITGTANFGGKAVTIKSDNTGTGAIGEVTGTNLTGATNVTVERFIPGKRAWRALTAPVIGNTNNSIFYNWQNNGTVTAGVGVELWSTSTTGGNGMGTGPSNSILKYNNSGTTGAWDAITNTNSNYLFDANINNAFMVFVTGPYATTSTNLSSGFANTTLKAKGQLITGTKTYLNLPSGVHTLIGNPYASPLSPSSLLNDNSSSFGNNLWVWDASAAGNYSAGAYNIYEKLANTYTNITNSNPFGTSPDIQSGQAFFVKASSGTATFTISESNKGSAISNSFLRTAAPELFRVGLYKQENNQWSGRDGAITVIFSEANANQDPNKMANSTENIAFTKNGALYASNYHLPLVASDVLNVKVWNTTAGANYKLKINTEQFATTNLDATLEDLFTNARTPLALDGTAVEYPFSVTTDALSTGDRFRIVFQTSTLGTTIPKATGFSIVPNPVTGDSFQVNLGSLATGTYSYSICNALGQEVEKGSINTTTQNTNYTVKFRETAATGIYVMKIKGSDNSVFTAKLIKK